MKRAGILLFFFLMLISLCSCTSIKEPEQGIILDSPFDYVLDAGVYTSLDFELAENYFAKDGIKVVSGCTAVVKSLDDGSVIVGRNMDMFITDKPVVISRTKVEGLHEVVGISYMFTDFMPSYKNAMKYGVPEFAYKIIPFFALDVMNDAGLYVEINMRYDEPWAKGEETFFCTGTNPGAKRLHMFQIPIYVGLNCSNIDEALDFIHSVDIYNDGSDCNFSFILVDSTGRRGLIEIAQNKIYWLEDQSVQTNFYLADELFDITTMDSGVGRYDKVMEMYDSINDKADMKKLMDSVSYFQYHFPETCQFDPRSEWVGDSPKMTYAFVTAPENQKKLQKAMASFAKSTAKKTREQMQKAVGVYWESTYSVITDIAAKTMEIKFYEDDDRVLTIEL